MRSGHGIARAPNPIALDRSPQTLPVPLGGLRPARRNPSTLLRQWRRHQPKVMIVTALVVGVCGVWLSVTPTTFTVAMTVAGVMVDGARLTPLQRQTPDGVEVFVGPASLAITRGRGDGTSRAGAVMSWGGVAATGQCVLVVLSTGASDACRFMIGASRLTAIDTYDARNRVWHRQYQDGLDVTIALPSGTPLIPIPFPLGH